MKSTTVHHRLRKNILGVLFAAITFSTAHAQSSPVAIEGYGTINTNAEISPARLRANLEGHVLTHLEVSTPEGDKEFIVRPSTRIVSGDKDKAFFEGECLRNDADKLFIQVYPGYILIHLRNTETGNSYMLAQEHQVAQAEFWRYLMSHYAVKTKMLRLTDLESVKAELLVRGPIGYVWVRVRETDEFIQSIVAKDVKTLKPPCHAEPSMGQIAPDPVITQLKGTINRGPAYDNAGKEHSLMGYIGKRDIYVNIYNWNNDVSAYDMGQMVALIPNSIAQSGDPRFGNIRVVVRQNPFTFNSANCPWNPNVDNFFARFTRYVHDSVKYANYDVVNPSRYGVSISKNDYHILLQRNYNWNDNILGRVNDVPGNYAVANVWTWTNGFSNALHEFGHALGAVHVPGCVSGYDDVMATMSNCTQLLYHTSTANKDNIEATVTSTSNLDEIPATATEILPAIENSNLAQDLFERTNNTSNITLTYLTAQGSKRIAEGPLFDGGQPGVVGDRITVYKVKLPSNAYYQFRIISANYDTYLYLLDKNGNLVAKDDDGVAGSYRSYISGNFNNDWYYVIVGGYSADAGTATLKIRYGWFQGGNWKGSPDEQESMRLDMGNGNTVYSADFGISTSKTTGVKQLKDDAIEVYPNPASANSSIMVNMQHAGPRTYSLYNNIGAMVSQGSLENAEEKIQLGSLPVGHYYLKVIDRLSGKVVTKHFVIM